MMTLKKQGKMIKNRNMVDTKKEKKSLIFTGIDAQSLFSEKLKLYIKQCYSTVSSVLKNHNINETELKKC